MSESPLFKRAFVRGLNSELIRQGVVVYPSKEASDFAADYVAENSGMPDPYLAPEHINVKVAALLCENLVKAANYTIEQNGNKYSPALTKTAQAESPVSAATSAAWDVMQKCAAETASVMEGGDNTNDMPAAAMSNNEAALENKQRPENYANLGENGVGNYERKGQGSVGTEEKHPEAPAATEGGTNSPIENSNKHGSLRSIVSRISKRAADEGQLFTPGGDANDMPAAAMYNAEAAQEMNRRPENYANKGEKGVGQSDMVPGPAQYVGTEQPHPEAPKATDSGTNVPVEHITQKSAFQQLFEQTAADIVPWLPKTMSDAQKVAQVRHVLGLDAPERAQYLEALYTNLGAQKTAAANVGAAYLKKAMPEGLAAYIAKKDEECEDEDTKDDEGEEKEEPEEKKDEMPENKEASARSLSALQAALQRLNA